MCLSKQLVMHWLVLYILWHNLFDHKTKRICLKYIVIYSLNKLTVLVWALLYSPVLASWRIVYASEIKCGYDFKMHEKLILYHIRVLPDWIKRGYDF